MSNSSPAQPDAAVASFPEAAWGNISLVTPDTLVMSEEIPGTLLDVVVTNDSEQSLDPDAGKGVAFSFRLIDENGQAIPHECTRTPLHVPVPAGAKHMQKVMVEIPDQYLEQVAAIRVGMLQKGEFWVERLYPQHPRLVQIVRGDKEQSHAQNVLSAADQTWPRGQSNGLRWPYGSMMVSEQHKLMYIPVAKCACTSLKSLMVKLAGVEQAELAIQLGVHMVTDRFNTGVQLKDKPMETARAILASDEYSKFSVIRNPLERLVSAYLEKFVYNRHSQRNLMHTRPLIIEIQGSEDIDITRSISFDEFVAYIIQQDPMDLDPHWRPQHLYFRGVRHLNRIFRLEETDKLSAWLEQQTGVKVELAHKNKTRKSDLLQPEVAAMTAAQIDELEAIDPASFLTAKNTAALSSYYEEDIRLYSEAG